MTRIINFAPKEFYHLYNRGSEKRDIFLSPNDYERFAALLYICNQLSPAILRIQGKTLSELIKIKQEENLVEIVTYCLMPNHIHLLVRASQENGISKFMQKLMTGYTMYFNKKYERAGALFQGKFKATHVSEDRYLNYLISYIHLNPIKLIEPEWKEIGISDLSRAEKYLDRYKYSSYLDYQDQERIEKNIINKNSLPKYFKSKLDFKKTIIEWLGYPHTRSNLV